MFRWGRYAVSLLITLVLVALIGGQARASLTHGAAGFSTYGSVARHQGGTWQLYVPSNHSSDATAPVTATAVDGFDAVSVGGDSLTYSGGSHTVDVNSGSLISVCTPGASGPFDGSHCDIGGQLNLNPTSAYDADLSSLTAGSTTFEIPEFSGTSSFEITVPGATSSLAVSATPQDTLASYAVNGSSGAHSVSLNAKGVDTTITVHVVSANATETHDYTITVHRGNNDADLSGLSVAEGSLSPTFSSSTTSYDVKVPSADTSVNVSATTNDGNATYQLQAGGENVTNPVTLDGTDPTAIAVVVTAENTTAQKTYTVNVSHLTSESFHVTFAGGGGGTVTSTDPNSAINCSSSTPGADTCTTHYDEGASVTLAESAAAGSYFNGWSGDCGSGTSSTTTFDMPSSSATCTAEFDSLGAAQTGTLKVTTGNDDADATDQGCYVHRCTLRDALAHVPNNGKITFAGGVTTVSLDASAVYDGGKTVTIDGAGAVTLDGGDGEFAGLLISNGTITVSDLTVTNFYGGGIRVAGPARVTLNNVDVTGNSMGDGGGIYAEGTLTMNGGNVANNYAGDCGGIEVAGTATLTGVDVDGNFAEDSGGGICVDTGATLTMNGGTVGGNEALFGHGGGINEASTLIVNGTSIYDNQANPGAGVMVDGEGDVAHATFTNVTLLNNQGDWAVQAPSPNVVKFVNTSFVANQGGISGTGATLVNTLFANNNGLSCDQFILPTSLGHNVADDSSCSLTATGDVQNVDVRADDPDSNHRVPLLNGSPALDAGVKGTVGGLTMPTKDAAGTARPQGGGIDIGALEMGEHKLTIKTVGSGTVAPDEPATTANGVATPGGWYVAGSTVTLTETPTGASAFAAWSGACSGTNPTANVVMNADSTCTATFADPPANIAFTPTSARIGATVTITGTHLANTTGVLIAGHGASFTVVSDTKLTAVVPSIIGTDAGPITVENVAAPTGVASSTNFTPLWPQPRITSFSPTKAATGATVTISGSNFLGVTRVTINGNTATITGTPTDTKLTVTVPTNAGTGPITVTTQGSTPTGTSATNFTFLAPPIISSLSADTATFGATITIIGGNFTGTTAVLLGGVAATFKVVTDGEITVTVPTTASNTPGPVSVTTSGGTTLSEGDFTLGWAVPSITSFSPAGGARPHARVTITGSHFTRANAVAFNGHAAASFAVVSDTKITAVVPDDVGTDSGPISVDNPGGTPGDSENFTPLWPQPRITSFSPTKAATGATVTINGSNFLGVIDVEFDGHPAAITGTPTDTKLTVTVPATADTGHISVTTVGSTPTGTSTGTFTFLPPPTITTFTSDASIGQPVVITGDAFTGTTSVMICDTGAKFTVKSATQITATVPITKTCVTGPITITNAGGTTVSGTNFTMDWLTPTITSFTPTSGKIGTVVTITGTHFLGASEVDFGGHAATAFTDLSDTKISAKVPAAAVTGVIDVSNDGEDGASTDTFTVINAPSLATTGSFAPTAGGAGQAVVITGQHLLATTKVTFNRRSASFSVDSDTQITAHPAAGSGKGVIAVMNAAGTATTTDMFTLVTITSFAPASLGASGLLTIKGSGLSAVTKVIPYGTFDDEISPNSGGTDTTITVNLATCGSTGKFNLVIPGATQVSSKTDLKFTGGACT